MTVRINTNFVGINLNKFKIFFVKLSNLRGPKLAIFN